MAQKKGCGKVHTMMLTQQLDHLGMSCDELEGRVSSLGAEEWALIVHDRDVSEDGSHAADHVHGAFYFKNARSIGAVARKLGVAPQYIEKWDAGAQSKANAFSYLTHRTTNARQKYQYDPSEVRASFDYPSWLEAQAEKAEGKRERFSESRSKANFVLDAVFDGDMTAREAADRLEGHVYARVSRQLRDVGAYRQALDADEWRRAHADELLEVLWVYGGAGVGKTRLAKQLAAERGEFFISGSTRDPWAGYTTDRHVAVLDELRPEAMSYADLLRVTDPHSIRDGVSAPARYRDVPLACGLIIVTTPFDPYSFWRGCVGASSSIDSFKQLDRRLSLVLRLTESDICAVSFDPDARIYRVVPGVSKPNPYSAPSAPPRSPEDVFNDLL